MRRDTLIPSPPAARRDMSVRALEAGCEVILHEDGANCDFVVDGGL